MLRRIFQGERAAVWEFALSGLLSVAVIGLIGTLAFRHIARDQALERAKDVTRLGVTGVVEPALTPGLLRGEPAAQRRFGRVMRRTLLDHSAIERIKLWTPQGRILWSDEPRLIGARYPLEEDELDVLRTGGVKAEVSDLSRPENRFERDRHKLLEVYLRARGPGGRALLFESYRPTSSISANTRELAVAFLPALLGGLVLLQLVNVPLARMLVRRVRKARRERETYLQAAMNASERERRKIAADLHDGVVQDLNGLSLSLAATARERAAAGDSSTATRLDAMAESGRQLTRGVRHALVDIYPPTLHREGLGAALEDLAESVRRRGIAVGLEADPTPGIAPDVEALLFRIGQEALRNVVSHADAHSVMLHVRATDGGAVLEVSDDGRGFDHAADVNGHLGLRSLEALTADAGGSFRVRSSPGAGTTVRAEVPLA